MVSGSGGAEKDHGGVSLRSAAYGRSGPVRWRPLGGPLDDMRLLDATVLSGGQKE
jgi:hypothetical protein